MSSFSDDHVVEAVRGLRRPDRALIRRNSVKRCRWLQNRIEHDSKLGLPVHHFLNDLKCTLALVEIAEARWAREDAEHAYVAEHEVGASGCECGGRLHAEHR